MPPRAKKVQQNGHKCYAGIPSLLKTKTVKTRSISFSALSAPKQNRRQKVFNRVSLRFCGGAWHSKNQQKLHWFIVFHISIWDLGALFGATKPTKAPCGDGTAPKVLTVAVQPMWSYQWLLLRHIAYPLTRRSQNSHQLLATVSQLWCFRAEDSKLRPAKTFCQ